MKEFTNLQGTLLWREEPVLDFEIEKGRVRRLLWKSNRRPLEFTGSLTDDDALLFFLEDRLVPETRIGIHQDIKEMGIPYYDPTKIIRFSHGFSMNDCYWIRFPEEQLTFEELKRKMTLDLIR